MATHTYLHEEELIHAIQNTERGMDICATMMAKARWQIVRQQQRHNLVYIVYIPHDRQATRITKKNLCIFLALAVARSLTLAHTPFFILYEFLTE